MSKDNEPQGNSDWLAEYELALVDSVGCDTDDCENEAVYFTRVACCGAVLLACVGCMKKVGKVLVTMIHQNERVPCAACDAINEPKDWMSKPEKLRLDTPA